MGTGLWGLSGSLPAWEPNPGREFFFGKGCQSGRNTLYLGRVTNKRDFPKERTDYIRGMKKKKKLLGSVYTAFNLRRKASDPLLAGIRKSIWEVEYLDVASGKDNMRKDIYRLRQDFKKAISEASDKIEKGECLSAQ